MKTMRIEKQLQFVDHVKTTETLQVQDTLDYQKEEDGIRAVGTLDIQGTYRNNEDELQQYDETLELDILAPNYKLGDDQFYLDVQQFEAVPNEDGINVTIYLGIHGLQDTTQETKEEERTQPDAQELPSMPVPQPKQPVTDREHTLDAMENIPTPATEEAVEEKPEEVVESDVAMDEFEDLFEDDETTYTSYRMVVARGNDSYGTIAQRYDVKEEELRNANHNKDIMEKSLIILPPTAA